MEKLHIQHGGIMTTSMNFSGLLLRDFLSLSGSVQHLQYLFYSFAMCMTVCRSPACFELNWPMKKDSSFLFRPTRSKRVCSLDEFCL